MALSAPFSLISSPSYFHRPRHLSPLILPHRPTLPVFSPTRLSSFSSPSQAPIITMSSSPAPVVEHVVLFKVRDDTDPSKSDAMIGNLAALHSLPGISHLSAAPLLRRRSAAADAAGFTHLLHSRYPSKDSLADYSAHPDHQAVVKGFVLPICDDVMAVDWVADLAGGAAALSAGKAVRLTLVKPKEGTETAEVLDVVAEAKERAPATVRQVSFGENFSPARAKGYTVAFLTVFDGVEELDAMDGEGGSMEAIKEKVRPMLESVIVVDFVVPAKPGASL